MGPATRVVEVLLLSLELVTTEVVEDVSCVVIRLGSLEISGIDSKLLPGATVEFKLSVDESTIVLTMIVV